MLGHGLVWLAVSVVVASCSGRDEAVGAAGREGQACQDYQDSLCDWVVRCMPGATREQCQAQASAIVCRRDSAPG